MFQSTRKILFFISVALFLSLVPSILLFTFGYKIDWKSLSVLKTGIIAINSFPQGADVYLNGKFLDKKTPSTIEELLPGKYSVGLVLDGFYPWQSDVEVFRGRVVSITNIMLFTRIPQFEKLNYAESHKFFIFEHDNNYLYYVIKDTNLVHKLDLDSGKIEAVFNADIFPAEIENIVLSPDRSKLLCFNAHNIAVIYLSKERLNKNFVLYLRDNIEKIFWHSDSEHFIVATNKDIKIYELFSAGRSNTIVISKISGRHHLAYYDEASDTLYFVDQQEALDGRRYDNIYKIVIGARFNFPFF